MELDDKKKRPIYVFNFGGPNASLFLFLGVPCIGVSISARPGWFLTLTGIRVKNLKAPACRLVSMAFYLRRCLFLVDHEGRADEKYCFKF